MLNSPLIGIRRVALQVHFRIYALLTMVLSGGLKLQEQESGALAFLKQCRGQEQSCGSMDVEEDDREVL